jgi:hypothetical protein
VDTGVLLAHPDRCAAAGAVASCDSGTLLDGRAALGPELHAPNTLGGTCVDGTAGTYHVDPSIDRVLVTTDDGSILRAGANAHVQVRVFASASWASERLELFTSTNPAAAVPTWQYLTSVTPNRKGSQVLVAALPLGVAGNLAVRAHLFRPSLYGLPLACGTTGGVNVVDDQDDLVFQVSP